MVWCDEYTQVHALKAQIWPVICPETLVPHLEVWTPKTNLRRKFTIQFKRGVKIMSFCFLSQISKLPFF